MRFMHKLKEEERKRQHGVVYFLDAPYMVREQKNSMYIA